jgi:hypothetical protein
MSPERYFRRYRIFAISPPVDGVTRPPRLMNGSGTTKTAKADRLRRGRSPGGIAKTNRRSRPRIVYGRTGKLNRHASTKSRKSGPALHALSDRGGKTRSATCKSRRAASRLPCRRKLTTFAWRTSPRRK